MQVIPQVADQLSQGKSIDQLQLSVDVGEVVNASVSGAVYGGYMAIAAPIGLVSALGLGAVGGALGGQAGGIAEAVYDDAADDGNITTASLITNMEHQGVGNLYEMAGDGVVGAVGAGAQHIGSATFAQMAASDTAAKGLVITNIKPGWRSIEPISRARLIQRGFLQNLPSVVIRQLTEDYGPEILSQMTEDEINDLLDR